MALRAIVFVATVGCRGALAARTTLDDKLVAATRSSRPQFTDPQLDCAWRVYALEYASNIQPWLDAAALTTIADALEIVSLGCNSSSAINVMIAGSVAANVLVSGGAEEAAGINIYVDWARGNDANSGTLTAPVKTIAAAQSLSRAAPPAQKPATITLRGGAHFLAETITLEAADSGTTFTAYPGETPVISSGAPLTLSWTPFNVSNTSNWGPVQLNTNAVYGLCPSTANSSSGGVTNKGTMASWQACQASCFGDVSCSAWTYHCFNASDPAGCSFGEWDHVCCWHTDSSFPAVQQDDVASQGRSAPMNVWTADTSAAGVKALPSMLVNGHRATLARFPNANPELDIFPTGYITTADWLAPVPGPVANETITIQLPPDTVDPAAGIYINYTVGVGGNAARYDPPVSFWASADFGPQAYQPTHVDDRWQEMHLRSPSGLDYAASLPRASTYKDVSQATIHTWRQSHWYSWMFGKLAHDAAATTFVFGSGGHQGGEGCDVAAEWWIDGVLEELDAPNEYFFDAAASTLYFFPNASDADPSTGAPPAAGLVAPTLHTFFNLSGSAAQPVRDVIFSGLTFTGGVTTFMEPHGVPSGGDWALERLGALLLEGTEGVAVTGCNFTRLDSNAVFLSGYNRGTVVSRNTFEWLGNSAVAAWGHSDLLDGVNNTQQPRGVRVTGNVAHDVGLVQKQSSFYFSAVACSNTLDANIVYNIPRAAVNIDDGFGGGNALLHNLLFNTCRESSDHGAFNSWSRMPYITTVGDGVTPSAIPAFNVVAQNFIVANYAADGGCLDNDDGSSFYNISSNFCLYGGHKSDFDGHMKWSYSNLHVLPQVYGPRCFQIGAQILPMAGYGERYVNNTCILGDGWSVAALDVPGPVPAPAVFASQILFAHNTIYAPGGNAGYEGLGGFKTYQEFMAAGLDTSSVIVNGVPSDATIIAWARTLLAF